MANVCRLVVVLEAIDERHVELAGGQARERVVGVGFRELEAHVGMPGAKRGDGARQQRDPRRREGAEAQLPGAQAGEVVELRPQGAGAGEDLVRAGDDQASGAGEANAAGAALEQLEAGLAFEHGDLLGHR